ncbi:MAG: cupin domain-containing protein [Chthoniobacterales bacterium]
MRKVNIKDIAEETWASPSGKFGGAGKEISIALGRKPFSTDLKERHPFDVEIARIPPGRIPYPYHAHSAQWEFYYVMSGTGEVRHKDGTMRIDPGDAFIFQPEEPHTFRNDGAEDLVLFLVADNPIGESAYYPDSKKWLVRSPERRLLRGESLDYYDGEE